MVILGFLGNSFIAIQLFGSFKVVTNALSTKGIGQCHFSIQTNVLYKLSAISKGTWSHVSKYTEYAITAIIYFRLRAGVHRRRTAGWG